jgi:anti-sigma regulatory factor (Ser/Thr protein kinase)
MAVRYIAVIAGLSLLLLQTLVRLAFGLHLRPDLFWLVFGFVEWIVLIPIVIGVATAVPYRHRQRWRFLGVHVVAALVLHAVHLVIFILAIMIVEGGFPSQPLATWVHHHTLLDLLVYGVTLVATQMSLYMRASQRREEERLALERSLAQAALDRLRLELPVHSVSERLLQIEQTIAVDADRAELLLEEFAASLRESLNVASVHAAIDQVAQDESEWEEELAPAARQTSLGMRLLLLFSILPVYQFFWSVVDAAAAVARNRPLSWIPVLWAASMTIEFFPVTLAMVWLGGRVKRVWPLVLAAATVPISWGAVIDGMWRRFGFRQEEGHQLIGQFDPIFFLGIALAALAYSRYREAAAAAAKVAEMETAMLRTRATLLRLQLNPHFLFNSLNSVVALLEDDAPLAQRMTAELRHFVVRVLERSDREEVPLSQELDSLAAYVAIENIRFEGRAQLAIEASDHAQRALVPSFLLQPLVENALRHGLIPDQGGRVSVQANVGDGMLHLTVEDNGRMRDHDLPVREGLGLSNTRARLEQIYGDGFFLDLARHHGGFRVTLGLPLKGHGSVRCDPPPLGLGDSSPISSASSHMPCCSNHGDATSSHGSSAPSPGSPVPSAARDARMHRGFLTTASFLRGGTYPLRRTRQRRRVRAPQKTW